MHIAYIASISYKTLQIIILGLFYEQNNLFLYFLYKIIKVYSLQSFKIFV